MGTLQLYVSLGTLPLIDGTASNGKRRCQLDFEVEKE
jgi:hypothetical protein